MKIGRSVLTNVVHEKLKALILDQRFSPGMHLNIDKLCRELQVSSSPLREALARLTAERLVQFEPFIGYSVTAMPDAKYYQDLMDVRLLLECQAVRIGAPKGLPSSIREMTSTIRAMKKARSGFGGREHLDYEEYHVFHSSDEQFHFALIASAESLPLSEAYAGLHVHLHIARLFVRAGSFDTVRPIRNHQEILNAFKAKDSLAAEKALRSHLCNLQVMKN